MSISGSDGVSRRLVLGALAAMPTLTGLPGQAPRLNDTHRAALAAIIESGPIPAVHGVVRWRIVDLCQWIWEEFRVVVAKQTLSRELRAMGYRKLSARPCHHAQAAGAIEDFKKSPGAPGRDRA